MASYNLEMHDDGGSSASVEITADTADEALEQVADECQAWAEGGEWGDDGASVSVGWTLTDEDDEEIGDGWETVEIEPNHSSLIAAACGYEWDEDGKTLRGCGADPDDHDWTREGEGGCTENPGVWSTGGTSMLFASHCRTCGLRRRERTTGSQRNPGEHDRVTYTMPETWCEECQREECACETED